MKRAVAILSAALFVFISDSFSISPSQEIEKIKLLSYAKEKKLYQNPYFLKLLYYEKDIFGKLKSRNINPSFFLSKWGAINPGSELNALINGLYYEGKEENNPQCLFPQRYFWLKKELGITETFPNPFCADYQDWADQIRPSSVNIVFASGYLNNPSTLYGHTFLLLKKEFGTSSNLLDYTVNYAASTGDEKGFFFALKGLSGLYAGNFTTMPYYIKIQEYVNIENRDLWEYPLEFSKEEIENLIRHLWELGKASFPYYFFNKNCSWQIVPLLEVSKPELNLKKSSGLWIIPSDTVKLIVSKAGKKHFEFRPSLTNTLYHKYSYLDFQEKKALDDLKKNIFPENLKDISKARVYETYSDFLELKFQRGKINKEKFDSAIDPVLSQRSKLGNMETFPPIKKPLYSPLDAQDSFMISGGKIFAKKRNYYELGIRPAFCDLLDDELGRIKNSQLKMGDLRLRYDEENNKLFIKEFALTDIISLNPLNGLKKDLSWSVFLGWKEYERSSYPKNESVFSLKGGPGLSFENKNILFFALADTEIKAGKALQRGWAAGAGPKLGVKYDLGQIKFLVSSSFTSFFSKQEKPVLDNKAEISFSFNKNLSLRMSLSDTAGKKEAGIYFRKFFFPL
ncbi:MAG: DUF4105 domain-containing protein [Elusimicrobia bacterium]|nr:DUF4105 domain-containing protein [Elusimicrobiota bacterium]